MYLNHSISTGDIRRHMYLNYSISTGDIRRHMYKHHPEVMQDGVPLESVITVCEDLIMQRHQGKDTIVIEPLNEEMNLEDDIAMETEADWNYYDNIAAESSQDLIPSFNSSGLSIQEPEEISPKPQKPKDGVFR